MIKQIDLFQENKLEINLLVEKLWGLYEVIDESEKTDDFMNGFHEYWDYLEEIIAVNKISDYENKIKNELIPDLKRFLQFYLSN